MFNRRFRFRLKKKKVQVRGTPPIRNFVRHLSIPRMLRESMSQYIGSRGIRIAYEQRPVVVRRLLKANRLPLVGIRSQIDRIGSSMVKNVLPQEINWLADQLKGVPAVRSVCQARHQRRRMLFKIGVAGTNKRLSPGRGGTYRRTVDSETSCKKVR